ncbi:hypothetical protein DICPUDRAFT_155890 [Dictyostelium purpureum]|uniref:Uncharacterized protein n=1 Tax=Dictyostelium purpureum TaxID=5786 RepID=F0ZV56_DICPU|nr:uncharacterized protein DICPUDRAFT_155890 [Dictyostelium purpureum]EGC32160.1 hypothetical protein DICPUDRAFT_155890 [Dictyostelium purpureum]|eukprot:XP_003291298.1 hypothetical protein DICPUDRAFT_155890 [Dictyostelium purpureum]
MYKEIIESLECKLIHYRRENEEIKDINSKKETSIQMIQKQITYFRDGIQQL